MSKRPFVVTTTILSTLSFLVGYIVAVQHVPVSPSEAPMASTSVSVKEIPTRATNAPTEPASASLVVYYELTEEERDLVERVVMAEAGAEPYEGQMAVAQCILNASLLEDLRPTQVVNKYQYAEARPAPSDSVKEAVAAVFDEGEKVIDPEAIFFYAPARVASTWHESQTCVATIGGHKFFKEADQVGEN